MKLFFPLFLMLLSYSLSAAVDVEMNCREAAPVVFSRDALNRITYQDGEVLEIIGDEDCFDINIRSGLAFVSLKQDVEDISSNLTVVTSGGDGQDLSVTTTKKNAEHVIIFDKLDQIESYISHTSTIDFLNSIVEGGVPVNYVEIDLENITHLDLPQPLQVNPVKVFEGQDEIISVYKLTNAGKKDLLLPSDSIKSSSHYWCFIGQSILTPKSSTQCILSSPRKGGL